MKLAGAPYLLIAALSAGCSTQSERQSTEALATAVDEWIGVYSSPSEIGVFTRTVLVVEKGLSNDLSFRKTFFSDVEIADSIEQDIHSGSCLFEANRIYIPEAFGYYRDGKPHLLGSIERYTKVTVNGHVTLMRDDAYRAFKSQNTLYDYGILIKVSTDVDAALEIKKVEHKSIKILYNDQTKQWNDPFVHGPNKRE